MKIKINKILMTKIGKGLGVFSVASSGIAGMGTGTASLINSRQRRSFVSSPFEIMDYSDKIKKIEEIMQKQDDNEDRLLTIMDDLEEIKKQVKENGDKISLADTDSDYTNAEIAEIRKLLDKRIDDALADINVLKNQIKTHGNLSSRISAIEEAVEKSELSREQLEQLKTDIMSVLEAKIKTDLKVLAGCDENHINLLTCVRESIPELRDIAKQKEFTEQAKQQLLKVASLLESIASPLEENQGKFEKILSEFNGIRQKVESLDLEEVTRERQELRQLIHEL